MAILPDKGIDRRPLHPIPSRINRHRPVFDLRDPARGVEVIDPVDDELDGLPNPNRPNARAMGKNSYAVSDDGRTQAFAIGAQNITVVQTENGAPVVRQLDAPTKMSGIATIAVSPDGAMLSLVNHTDESRTRWMIDLTDSAGEWVGVPNEVTGSDPGMIQFVGGSGH